MVRNIILFIFASIILIVAGPVQAFVLSASPVEGGGSLRFGRVSSKTRSKEVRLRVTDTGGARYQVRQRLIQQPQNNRGREVGRRALIFYTAPGSNLHGTLYQQMPTVLGREGRVLYTSAAGGAPDSFIIAYQIDPKMAGAEGEFFGRIQYTVRSLGSRRSEETTIVNIYFTLEPDFKVELTTSSSQMSALTLKEAAGENSSKQGSVKFEAIGGTGEPYSIIQEFKEPFRSSEGRMMPPEPVLFMVQSPSGESFYPSFSLLSSGPTLIYSSESREDSPVWVNYKIPEESLSSLTQGLYTGRMSYQIKKGNQPIETFIVPVKFEVDSQFSISVKPEMGSQLLFRNLKHGLTAKRTVSIEVESNQGRPFMVVQKTAGPLVNSDGAVIPFKFLKVKGLPDSREISGLISQAWQPLSSEDMVVYSSGPAGEPVSFQLRYSLALPQDARPGDYYTQISYDLVEK